MYIAYVFRMWFLLLRQHKKWRDGVVQEIKKSARRELDLLNIMSDLKYPTKMCANMNVGWGHFGGDKT
jgi:hypothetical protein